MPVLEGSPWRGAVRLNVRHGAQAEGRFVWTTEPEFGTGQLLDRSLWEGTAGAELSLTFLWTMLTTWTTGRPTHIDFEVYAPGDATPVHSYLSVPFPAGDTGSLVVPVRFNERPLPGATPGNARAGMLELYVRLRSGPIGGTGLTDWSVDTRGNRTGLAAGGAPTVVHDWAAGYVRARAGIASVKPARTVNGALDAGPYVYPDELHHRLTLAEPLYRPPSLVLDHRGAGGGTAVYRRASTTLGSGSAVADFAFTGSSSSSPSRRIDSVSIAAVVSNGAAYPAASSQPDTVVYGPLATFGDDLDREFRFDATRLPAGWTLIGGTEARAPGLVTVDPRITAAPHLQINSNAYATPPASVGSSRLTADLGFVGARFTNARGDALSETAAGRGAGYSLRDAGALVNPLTLANGAVTVRGGVGGYGPLLAWDSALPGGAWTNTVTFTDAAGVQGTAQHSYSLIASDPRVRVLGVAGNATAPGAHLVEGDELVAGIALLQAELGTGLAVDAGTAEVAITRINVELGRREVWTGAAWTAAPAAPAALPFHPLAPSSGDPLLFTGRFSTAGWGTYDLALVMRARYAGTPYSVTVPVELVAGLNRHDRYQAAFPPFLSG